MATATSDFGSTAIAAVETGRHYVGFDTEEAYIELAEQRITEVSPE